MLKRGIAFTQQRQQSKREMDSDSLTTIGQGGGPIISAVHPDILQAHILTRLDGPSLVAAGCASSQLHALSAEEKLWRDICNHTWPSTADPRVRRLISTFPAGHRSFYSDSFPALDHRFLSQTNRHRLPPASKLISAVDIRYQNRLILSKVHEAETVAEVLLCSPFRVDLLDPKETVPVPVKLDTRDDKLNLKLEANLTVSWILIDPTQNRAASVSSPRPVSVNRNWLTGDIELRYVTVHAGNRRGELVQCGLVVTFGCGGRREAGELLMREVSLQVEDMEGKNLNWKDSLVTLQEAMVVAKRRKGKRREEKERYEEYLRLKSERRERKQRRERRLELVCVATSATIFLTFSVFVTLRFLQLLHLY